MVVCKIPAARAVMIKRRHIRGIIWQALTDPSTAHRADGEIGLSIAGDEVYDTPLSPPSGDCNEADLLDKDSIKLPAIGIYTEDETLDVTDNTSWNRLCLDASKLSVLIELYVCAKDGIEMEGLLDDLEESVRFKLFNNTEFQQVAKVRGYRSIAVRNGQGQRLGLRRIMINLEYTENVRAEECQRIPLKVTLNTPDVTLTATK